MSAACGFLVVGDGGARLPSRYACLRLEDAARLLEVAQEELVDAARAGEILLHGSKSAHSGAREFVTVIALELFARRRGIPFAPPALAAAEGVA